MKKLVALILAIMMAVCVFSACNLKKTSQLEKAMVEAKKITEQEKGPITDVVTDFNKLWVSMDSECMKYVAEDCEDRSMIESYVEGPKTDFEDMKEVFDVIAEKLPENRRAELDAVYQDFAKEYMEIHRSTEIGDVVMENDKTASVYVTINQPDNEPMAFDVILERAKEASGYDEQALVKADPDTKATAEIALMDSYCGLILQVIGLKMKPVETIYKLEKTDGKWLINSIREKITSNSVK